MVMPIAYLNRTAAVTSEIIAGQIDGDKAIGSYAISNK